MENSFDPFSRTFLPNWGKNEGEDDNIWENEFDFWIIHIKIKLYGNFHESQLKNVFTHILGHFWLIEAKMKMKVKKYGEIFSIFEFSILKWGYVVIFMKIGEKKFLTDFLRNFWLTEAKIKMKTKKFAKMISIFYFYM